MIYRTLRKLPMVTYVEIIDTGDITLLSDEDTPIEELVSVWESLREEYQNRYNKQDSNKIFNLSKEIEYLEKKYITINNAVIALRFDVYQNLIDLLQGFGYTLRMDQYNSDLDRIERESTGINIKINALVKTLPKQPEKTNDGSVSIVTLMAGYSMILGYDFDYYTISVEKFHTLEYQVKQKVAAIEKNNAKKK